MKKRFDVASLPKWAQARISDLETTIRGYEARIDGDERVEGGLHFGALLTPKERQAQREFNTSLKGAKAVNPPMLAPAEIRRT